ncbi:MULTISPECIES: CopG family ribbon-helix-helix protein [Candidatus Nitrosocaldus]|uniref:Putative nickel-responsive regulator 1 n=1 Tax=Candidatus Nitrosocaldus cavascurensis TaxID=2058097 RepID=A0A2K5AQH5_9ARCH|nr:MULTISPECIES: CopG family ribbon-helix-helix protein [Candidatus Nitrosocaldus]GBC74250.1 Putative nickel-responsive regulator [archaeon HR05]SPC33903.1 putative nickel-responsive regulator 1 [Candidatus Nitrosocaldus cavascurensis]
MKGEEGTKGKEARIVSISLTDSMLKEIDELQKEFGFSGRSEVIRAGIRMLLTDRIEKERLAGSIGCVLIVTHDEEDEASTKIKLRYEDIIKTHLHCKLKNKKCLELFVIEGDAEKVKDMTREFQANEGMEHVRLIMA